MTDAPDILPPYKRNGFLSAPGLEMQLTRAIDQGALANGWLITGPEGVGKATLAYRLARALLNDGGPALNPPAGSRTSSLIAARAHPDLFVAERLYDEKKDREASEIAVDTARDLISFLNHTASMGGWRVAIIDTADDLNRSSANALLKALEEPPPRTALFVLSAAPGHLLATIRSRCRRLALRPYADEDVAGFLEAEGAATGGQARQIAAAAEGRPGFALRLAAGDGPEAIEAVDAFLAATDVMGLAQKLAPKGADGVWPIFQELLLRRIDRAARDFALNADRRSEAMVKLRETIGGLFARGEAVNLDRFQVVLAAARAAAQAPRIAAR